MDRRILSVYNHLLPVTDSTGRGSLLEPSRRLWGYDNRPVLPQGLLRRAIGWPTITASVSRLQSFARCPYQHFSGSLLKLRPRPTAQVSPLETGSLAHRALEVLYKEGLPSADREATSRRLTEILGRVVHEENLRAFLADPTGEFRGRSCGSQILRFLDAETARQRKSEFRPHAFEEAFGTKGAPPLRIELTEETSMLLRGRIDRIDLRESGGRREALVIDYKSGLGVKRGRPADLRDGRDLQLGVYLLVAEDRGWVPAAALYAPVLPSPRREEDLRPDEDSENPLQIRFRGIVPMSRIEDFGGLEFIERPQGRVETPEDLAGLLAEAKEILARLGRAILEGRIDVSPAGKGSDSACEHCDFAALCRVDAAYNPPRRTPIEGFAEKEISP